MAQDARELPRLPSASATRELSTLGGRMRLDSTPAAWTTRAWGKTEKAVSGLRVNQLRGRPQRQSLRRQSESRSALYFPIAFGGPDSSTLSEKIV
jgi:hypothetical protein